MSFPEVTPYLLAVLTAVFFSLIALFTLFQKHLFGQSLLPYEPRQRVPWGSPVVLLAMGMPLLGVLAFLLGESEPPEAPDKTLLLIGWGNFAFMVLFVVGVAAWLATFFRADARDLGLPTSWQQFTKDIGIGSFAAVAAILPIYAIQLTLSFALQSNTPHPLVKQLEENHSPAMLLLGFAMAVIAAPLFEEFTFRGLLQGWLEKREDEALAFNGQSQDQPAATSRPSRGWVADLPHGWTPILISGVAFGAAHLGHGVAPVSLVLFGIVLGYLYQRTHRLVPSITAHMLFNAYSLVLLWLQLEAPSALS